MKYIMITFAISLLVVSAHAGTYVETFDDGNFDGWEILNWTGGTSEWKVEDGILIGSRPDAASALLMFGEEEWRNYSIEFDARMLERLSANWHAIALDLRVSDVNHAKASCNSVYFSANGQTIIWLYLGNREVGRLAGKGFAFQSDRWYRIKGVADEDNFQFYIDGELMVSLSDSRFPAGRVALDVNGSTVQFDNVVITGDDVPDNTAAVSASGKLATTWGKLRSQQD